MAIKSLFYKKINGLYSWCIKFSDGSLMFGDSFDLFNEIIKTYGGGLELSR